MRFQRLLMEVGGSTVTLDFHPRLTVVAGVGPLEREALVTELIGGLATSRPGTHIQVVTDEGRGLGVMHPKTLATDRVVDLDTQRDVTGEFVRDDGRVDLLAPHGLTLTGAMRACRMSAADMAALAQVDDGVAAMAALDQDSLWAAADRLSAANHDVATALGEAGANPVDPDVIDEIERRHDEFEVAEARLERLRHFGIVVGVASVLAAMAATFLRHWAAAPFLGVAAINTVISVVYRRRMERARRAEQQALEAAGVTDYLSFRLHRIDGLFDGKAARQRVADAVAVQRDAQAHWWVVAGEVNVDWAQSMRERIMRAAARMAESNAAGSAAMAAGLAATADPGDLAQALVSRLSELRHAGTTGESMPLVLDEPFSGAAPSVKQWLLELVGRTAGTPQVVYLTNDPEVATWARHESIGGEVALIGAHTAKAAPDEVAPAAL